ncbi:MAG TPA: alpha-(1-_3)-arabinofuranosyltransferase family protein [Acidimicrobiia bacterium]|nr:alpha-(1->3)-arabinofuranosyltransferase family protein [Acidimicrobiia bacterium]
MTERARFWTTSGVLVAAAAFAVLTNSPGWYIADARFEQYWGAQRYIARQQWLWDSVRGVGRPAPFFSPVIGSYLALLRTVGLSPALSERMLHGTYLVIAGLGMVQVLRLFRPRLGPEHLLAALFYMFSPFTTQFLVPSGLFVHYALAPWLLMAFVRGVREPEHQWPWAAAFALAVLTMGGLNTPSLVYAALPILPTAIYLGVVTRSVPARALFGFLGRMVVLTLAITSATLIYLRFNVSGFAENLGTTELPRTVSSHSTWAESWRGLGNWLSYLRTSLGVARPESISYFTNALVVAATCVIPVVAVAVVWRSRWRPRLVFGGMAVLALVLMVGLYPTDHLTIAGRVLQFGYDHSLVIRSFRDTYKAGAGLGMGLSALFAVGVIDGTRWLGRRRPPRSAFWIRFLGLGLAVIVIGVASFPFWTGRLYSRTNRVAAVPQYWRSATAWLDRQPGDGRVLVLPGTTRTRYRWGYVGDDILDALLARPHLVRESLPQGLGQAADLLVALDDAALSRTYLPGSVAAVAQRLGVRWIVLRNDVAWETSDAPRPSDLNALRADATLHRVATFGRPGQNVITPGDVTARQLGEGRLPPVEVYQVRGAGSPVQVVARQPTLLLSGSGEAWPALSSDGTLAAVGAVRYTAASSAGTLRPLLAAGARVVVTDTNRRQVTQVTTLRNFVSPTLAANEQLTRAPDDLFHRPGSQSLATYADATQIVASRYGNPVVNPFQTWVRPANAFDGDPNTAWYVGGLSSPVGAWVRVDFKRPERISRVDLTRASTGRRRVTAATLRFSDGTTVPVGFTSSSTTATFKPRTTRSLEVRIRAVLGFGGSVGFSEVTIPGLNLTETIAAPTDLAKAATASPALSRALAGAPLTFSFQRLVGDGASDTELAVHRSFTTLGTRSYQVGGTLQLDSSTPADAVALARSGLLSPDGCTDRLLTVDGRPVAVRLTGSSLVLIGGRPVDFQACSPVSLARGQHRLDSRPGADGVISTVALQAGAPAPATRSAPAATVRVLSESPTRLHLQIAAPHGGSLVIGQSFSADWHASASGHALGSAQSIDTLTGWQLPHARAIDVVASYRPQRLWELALAITGGTTALCIFLVVGASVRRRAESQMVSSRPSPDRREHVPVADSVGALVARALVLATVGYLLGGLGGALLAGLAALIAVYDARLVGLYALFGVAFMALLTVFESPLDASPAVSGFVGNHPAAAFVGRLAGLIFLVAIATLSFAERAGARAPSEAQLAPRPRPPRAWRDWAAPIGVFALGFGIVVNVAGDRSLRWLAVPCLVVVLAALATAGLGRRRGPLPPAASSPPIRAGT